MSRDTPPESTVSENYQTLCKYDRAMSVLALSLPHMVVRYPSCSPDTGGTSPVWAPCAYVHLLSNILSLRKMVYSWFTMLSYFLLHSKVNQPSPLLFRFFSHIGHYRAPCAIQLVLLRKVLRESHLCLTEQSLHSKLL